VRTMIHSSRWVFHNSSKKAKKTDVPMLVAVKLSSSESAKCSTKGGERFVARSSCVAMVGLVAIVTNRLENICLNLGRGLKSSQSNRVLFGK
jgi:hypothetical protein